MERLRPFAAVLAAVALAAGLLTAAQPAVARPGAERVVAEAAAPGLTRVPAFGSNPGNLSLYSYAPADLPPNAPLVVALHGCGQSAADYFAHSGWDRIATRHRFALALPQTDGANNPQSCFNWFEPGDSSRDRGEAASVRQAVTAVLAQYGGDPRRVFLTGLSAGGAMTANLLAAYPDVFAGGSIASGLPASCATSSSAAYTCMYVPPDRTPAQWGALVRAAAPAGTTAWPRVAVWQGTADTTVRPANATELRDQWTDVWGTGQTPSRTSELPGRTTLTEYDDPAGRPAVQVYSVAGMAHGLAVDPGAGEEQCGTAATYYLDTLCSSLYTARFWGLDGDGGGEEPGALPAPTGVRLTGAGDTTASLTWDAVPGAASYAVLRDGARVAGPTGTSYTDTGLTPGTSYAYRVSAVGPDARSGTPSAVVTVRTTGTPPGGGACFTANNYAHTVAGRARQSGGQVFAVGSGQAMGLWNTAVTHTLRETSPGYFVLADGPGGGCAAGATG
ncbi:PHB depolymerase family esterase [Streptomyces sp. NPDC091272]|uniref:extracellular catalytic domain type 1 short-chain-length polyhydroxyalkanoate depolymerase n=1 Tax=Streptomyces sp. NPDC091272 TaxID=3365981 RepID=UPI003801472A